MGKNKDFVIKILILLVMIICAMSIESRISEAQTFNWNPIPPLIFNATEDVIFTYDINVTTNESKVNFSSTAADSGFLSFNLNTDSGLINFSPTNDEVGITNYFAIISTNISDGTDGIVRLGVRFNISNTNDPPNITSYQPLNLIPNVAENTSLLFNVTAADIDIPYGDTLNFTWYVDNALQQGISISSTQNAFNYSPSFLDSGTHNITIIIFDINIIGSYTGTNATLVWNVTVNNTNRDPVFNRTIDNITWPEDTNLVDNITLSDYFFDLDIDNTLTYGVSGNSNIVISINQTTANVSFYPAGNFTGVNIVQFSLYDSYTTVYSNNVTLNLTPVNDSPTLQPISNASAFIGSSFNKQIQASDIDGDNLTYYDNTSLFNINSSTGLISFIPQSGDKGNHTINITISDGIFNVSGTFVLEIRNNSIPVLGNISSPQNATEGILFTLNVNASDGDNDPLTFGTNFSLFSTNNINNTHIQFFFTPSDPDVGNYTILINVTDDKGAFDFKVFNLTVIDVSNPPILTPIQDWKIKIDIPFNTTINATDADNEDLTFSDNTTLFDITFVQRINDRSFGFINFTPNASDVGVHYVNIGATDGSQFDSQIVIFNITNNTAPNITTIPGIQQAFEDSLFALNLSATDPDFQDTLTWYDNSTLFNITSLDRNATIGFTPVNGQEGIYSILINVTDGTDWDNITFLLNISAVNDPPQFVPPLDTINFTAKDKFLKTINISATDEEGYPFNFAVVFLNFTDASGNVSYNRTLFNFTDIDNNTILINYTPQNDDVGIYYVNISVTDNGSATNYSVISFIVENTNDAPVIINYTPIDLTPSVAETYSLNFSVNISDVDFEDNFTYYWYINGSLNRTFSTNITYDSFTYSPDYLDAGIQNITIVVSDYENATDSLSWNVTVNDTNRLPYFGKLFFVDRDDFIGGSSFRVIISDNITIALNGSNYYSQGIYTSPTTIMPDDDQELAFTYLNWSSDLPSGTNITFETRASIDLFAWSSWTALLNATNSSGRINETNQSYIQYRSYLNTGNLSNTPVLDNVTINYIINNITINQNSETLWIYLNEYFFDPDTDNNITYNVTGNNNINITILSNTRVNLKPDTNFIGLESIVFTANDGYETVESNNITITVLFVPQQQITTPTTVTRTRTVTIPQYLFKEKEVEKPTSVDLIFIKDIIYDNLTIKVPFALRNPRPERINYVSLNVTTNMSGILLRLSENYFEFLDPNEQKDIDLVMQVPEEISSFEVNINANVQTPQFKDSVLVAIQRVNITTIEELVIYAKDLLGRHPECLELNEFLVEAENAIINNEPEKASRLLDSIIQGCNFLLSPAAKQLALEQPVSIEITRRAILTPFRLLIAIIATVTMITTLIIVHFIRKKKAI